MESPYNEIHLSNEELSALKAAKDGYIKIDPSLKRLHAENLLYYNVHGFNGNPGYVITERGKAYLLYLKDKNKAQTISTRRYWITTVISILAFIEATISLILHFI